MDEAERVKRIKVIDEVIEKLKAYRDKLAGVGEVKAEAVQVLTQLEISEREALRLVNSIQIQEGATTEDVVGQALRKR